MIGNEVERMVEQMKLLRVGLAICRVTLISLKEILETEINELEKERCEHRGE